MRVLVTGSRTWTDAEHVETVLAYLFNYSAALGEPFTLVHGDCPNGLDAIAKRIADRQGWNVEPHPARNHPTQDFGPWPGAGPRRNAYVVSLGADRCCAWIGMCGSNRCSREPWPHPSHGASHCADLAEAAGIPTWRYTGW